MITIGTKITIIPSAALTELRLNALLGATGYVLEDLTDKSRTIRGYMVFFPDAYKEEHLWFIPQESAYEQD